MSRLAPTHPRYFIVSAARKTLTKGQGPMIGDVKTAGMFLTKEALFRMHYFTNLGDTPARVMKVMAVPNGDFSLASFGELLKRMK